VSAVVSAVVSATRPRLGLLGTGWIGRSRLRAVAASGVAEIAAALADPAPDCRRDVALDAPGARLSGDLAELLHAGLDGIVIATPSALPDDWGGRAAVDRARRLAAGERYDAGSRRLVTVAEVINRIYGR
jgi:hypothetical protein